VKYPWLKTSPAQVSSSNVTELNIPTAATFCHSTIATVPSLPLSTGICAVGAATASAAGAGCSPVGGSFPVRSFRLTGAAPVLAPLPVGPPLGVTRVPRLTRDCKNRTSKSYLTPEALWQLYVPHTLTTNKSAFCPQFIYRFPDS
jgi:hypothetical protein